MKVTVRGINYTGEHFRLLSSKYDSKAVDITLIGTDKQIVRFVCDNFDWPGNAAKFDTVGKLCDALSNDDTLMQEGFDPTSSVDEDDEDYDANAPRMMLGQFDGAGGVVFIKSENGNELFEVGDTAYFADKKVIDLGVVVLDALDAFAQGKEIDGYYDYVNYRVREAVDNNEA